MVYLDGLNIPESYPLDPMQLFEYAYTTPIRIFKGYKIDYHFQRFGYAEFDTAVLKKAGEENEILGISNHLTGDNIYRMKIEKIIPTENSECLCVCSTLDGDYNQIVAHIEMPDVLPSLLPGDDIRMQGVGWLVGCSFFDDQESAEKAVGLNVKAMEGKLHLRPGFSFIEDEKEGTKQIFTKVNSINKHPGFRIPAKNIDLGVYTLEVDSFLGPLSLVIPKNKMNDEVTEKLHKGKEQYIIGRYIFSGDVAIDEYNNGAIYDEEHLLRLLRYCLDTGDFSRLDRGIADDCRYDGWKKHLDKKEDIIEHLKKVNRIQADEGNRSFHYLGTTTEVMMPEVAVYPIGKRCLLERTEKGKGIRGFCFIELNSENIIGHISFLYDPVYKFQIDIPEENPNYPKRILYRTIKPKHTIGDWQSLILEWATGKRPSRLKMEEVFLGLDRDCILRIDGKVYQGRKDIFIALKKQFSDSSFKQREDLKDAISLKVSNEGKILEIFIQ